MCKPAVQALSSTLTRPEGSLQMTGLFIRLKILTVFVALISAATGCGQHFCRSEQRFSLRQGDILFQDLDCGELCEAIEKVTAGRNGANLSHIGIVAKNPKGDLVVIEATADGVKPTPIESFLNRSCDRQGRPKVLMGRLNSDLQQLIPKAVEQARLLIGKSYDKQFEIGDDEYYCSELIYHIFLKANDDKALFELQPMTFCDPDTDMILPAWQKYFDELDIPVPQGEPGINPGGISQSPGLTIIHSFGNVDGYQKSP